MKIARPQNRREFLKTTGEALTLFSAAISLTSTVASATESSQPWVKRNSPNIRRLLDEMETKGYQFLSPTMNDGFCFSYRHSIP